MASEEAGSEVITDHISCNQSQTKPSKINPAGLFPAENLASPERQREAAAYWCNIWLNAHFIGFWLLISVSGNGKGFYLPQRLTRCYSSCHRSTARVKWKALRGNCEFKLSFPILQRINIPINFIICFPLMVFHCVQWDRNHLGRTGWKSEKIVWFIKLWHFVFFYLSSHCKSVWLTDGWCIGF